MARFYDRPLSLAQHHELAEMIVKCRRRLAMMTRHTLSGRVPACVLDAALRVDRQLATLCLKLGEALGDHGVYAFDAPVIAPAPRSRGRRLDVEGHRRLGAELHRLRGEVAAVTRALQPYFALASPVGRAMHRPERELDRLRCMLDELFCRHHAAAFDPVVYYPGPTAPAARPVGHTLLICDRSYSAAAVTLGYEVLDLPPAGQGPERLIEHLSRTRPQRVVIIADLYEGACTAEGEPTWPGIEGGLELAARLMPLHRNLRFCLPPTGVGDLGKWIGVSEASTIRAAIDAAPQVHPVWLNRAWQNVRDNRRLRGSWARRAACALSEVADAQVRAGLRGVFEDRVAALASDPQMSGDEAERRAFEEVARKAVGQ